MNIFGKNLNSILSTFNRVTADLELFVDQEVAKHKTEVQNLLTKVEAKETDIAKAKGVHAKITALLEG